MIFLDATVLDKAGHPVVQGLTRNDFVVTDGNRSQPILSFEEPILRGHDAGTATHSRIVLVLDFLNSSFQDVAFIRTSVRNYLLSQPPTLKIPTELLVLDDRSLQGAQSYTRSRSELLQALDREASAVHDQERRNAFFEDRYRNSIHALHQIALQNNGVPGPKSLIWVGRGGPNFVVIRGIGNIAPMVRYTHETSDLLLDARMSLFVVYPGLAAEHLLHGAEDVTDASTAVASLTSAQAIIGAEDPFADNMNFGVFANLSGGEIFYDHNDIAASVEKAEERSLTCYTLSYIPSTSEADGRFRRIHVTLRDPALHIATKTGYFAPSIRTLKQLRQQTVITLTEVTQSNLSFDALGIRVQQLVRHPDTGTVEVKAMVELANAAWQSSDNGDNGRSTTSLVIAVAALGAHREVLASRVETLSPTAATQDPSRLAREIALLAETIHDSQKTRTVRLVVEDTESGRMGALELDRKALDAAPAAPTPTPQLLQHPHTDLR